MKQFSVKFAGVFAVVAFALTVAAPVKAQTVAELQALIAQLQAQIGAIAGGTSSPTTTTSYTFTADLTLGSTGADVVALQSFLESKGMLTIPTGVSKGYFGEMTRAALAKYQMSKMISPAVGYFGPMTRAAVNQDSVASVNPGTGTPTTPGSLSGEGDLEVDVTLDSDVVIDLGDTEEVLVLDIEAVDGDVRIDRIDFMFSGEDEDDDAITLRPWLYFDEVTLEIDGKEVDSLSGSGDFSEDGDSYRARFSGLNVVVEEDDKVEVTLIVKVLPSMQGSRDLHTVFLDFDVSEAIRFVDGSGAVLFGATGTDPDTVEITFDEEFGQGGTSVTIGDNSPEDATIVLDADNRTNGVEVLEFEVEAEDDDIEVQDVTVTFATAGSGVSTVANTLYRAYLYQGGDLIASKSVSGNSVLFDDLEVAIDEDDTESFTVEVDFNKTEGLTIDEFAVVSVAVAYEDSDFSGDTETLSVNETHQLVVEGLVDTFDSKSSKTTTLGTTQTNAIFTFEFELTAYEDEFYIAEDGSGFTVVLDNASTTVVATTIASTNATLTSDDSYRINKGQTRTFKVDVEVESNTGSQSVRATLSELEYDTDSDLDGTSADLTLGAPDYRSTAVTVFVE